MEDNHNSADFDIVSKIISSLKDLDQEAQIHILKTVAIWLKIDTLPFSPRPQKYLNQPSNDTDSNVNITTPQFTTDVEMSPKQFMLEKQPRTDVERLACLAYYLTHHQNTPQFKTIDLSKLNTEAAQRKFSNAADTAKNAVKAHFFVQAPKKGHRQLSAEGEQIIAALPDREAAAAIRKRIRPRRNAKSNNKRATKTAKN